MVVVCMLFSMSVIVTHMVVGNILTTPMLIALGGLNFFCLAERADIRHLNVRVGKEGVHANFSSDGAANGQMGSRHPGGHSDMGNT